MMFLPASGKRIPLLILLSMVLLATGALFFLSGRQLTQQATTPTGNQDSSEFTATSPDVTLPVLTVYVNEDVTEATPTYTLALDSQGVPLTGVSLRLRFEESSAQRRFDFALTPELEAAGWRAMVSQSADEAAAEDAYYDLGLVNSQPDGKSVFTSTTALGTLTAPSGLRFMLDPEISVAGSNEGKQYRLQLVQVE